MDEKTFAEAVERVKRRYPDIGDKPTHEIAADRHAALWLISPDSCREADIETSRTDKYMWDGLRLAAIRHLREGHQLPDALAIWVADVLARKKRARRPRGGSRNEARDRLICLAIHSVTVWFDLRPTRDVGVSQKCGPSGGSACDVVGAAAFPGEIAYKRTAKIWENRDDWLNFLSDMGGLLVVSEYTPSLRDIPLERLG